MKVDTRPARGGGFFVHPCEVEKQLAWMREAERRRDV